MAGDAGRSAGPLRRTLVRLRLSANPLDNRAAAGAYPRRGNGGQRTIAMQTLAVIGLGRLGLPMAVAAAGSGNRVIGVDRNGDLVRRIEAGELDDREPGLGALRRSAGDAFAATTDIAEAVRATEISLIVVPTPSDASGGYALDCVADAVGAVGAALGGSNRPHTVAIASTVMPGACAGVIAPALESAAGRRLGNGFGLCYSPIFAALGEILHGYRHPDFVLIGESHPGAGEPIERLHRSIIRNDAPTLRLPLIDAELAKLALNCFVTTKIAFANMMAALVERIPGADIDRVLGVLARDRRIGAPFLKAAMPYGGPCFARDNRAMAMLAERLAQPAELSAATEAVNRRVFEALRADVLAAAPAGSVVAMLGLAFKAGTDVLERSPALALAKELMAAGRKVRCFDPALAASGATTCEGVPLVDGIAAAVADAAAVVIANPEPAFAALAPALFAGRDKKPTLFDYWRLLEPARFEGVASIRHLGVGPGGES